MSRQSTIRDLTVMARRLETEKRDLDKKVEAIHVTLRELEQDLEEPESEDNA